MLRSVCEHATKIFTHVTTFIFKSEEIYVKVLKHEEWYILLCVEIVFFYLNTKLEFRRIAETLLVQNNLEMYTWINNSGKFVWISPLIFNIGNRGTLTIVTKVIVALSVLVVIVLAI
jgi:hypothetical protein